MRPMRVNVTTQGEVPATRGKLVQPHRLGCAGVGPQDRRLIGLRFFQGTIPLVAELVAALNAASAKDEGAAPSYPSPLNSWPPALSRK